MKNKKEKKPTDDQRQADQQPADQQPQLPSLMAVQEKLGLFAPITPADTHETHQILTKKPLGYI